MAGEGFDDFSLWIEPLAGGLGYRVTARSEAGEASETVADLPGLSGELEAAGASTAYRAPEAAAPMRDLVAAKRAQYDPRRVGDELFRAVLGGRVGRLFSSTRGALHNARRGLRIRFHFDPTCPAAASLCALQWELLYDAETKDYLGINPLTPLVRYLEVQRGTQVADFAPPLRLLVVASNPAMSPALDLQRERSLIEQAWAGDQGVDIKLVERCDPESLREHLCESSVDVLHFMGHAAFDEATGTGALLLDGSRGRCQPMPGEVLADLLKGRLPRLVVLNACASARAVSGAGRDFFSGLAAAVVMGGVPAVVAMRAPISDLAAIRFSKALYGQLARGLAVEAAVAEGRRALYVDDRESPAWGTPVLFMRVRDGRLFDVRSERGNGQPVVPVDAASGAGVRPPVLRDKPSRAESVEFSALGALDRGQINSILAQYKAALALNGEDAETHFSLGLLYLQLRLFDASLKHFKKSIDLAPESADGYYYYGLALIRGRCPRVMSIKEVRVVEEYLQTALQLDANQAKYYYLLGIVRADYYGANGLQSPQPGCADLFRHAAAKADDPWEVARLLASMTVRDEALIAQLRRD
jgi:tetratricopeptide (TPR) repeat protein